MAGTGPANGHRYFFNGKHLRPDRTVNARSPGTMPINNDAATLFFILASCWLVVVQTPR
jgi:hypothetical protein